MGKAARDHTPKQPPLDDIANWLPMKAAHQRWAERTQDNELAVIELTKALAHDLPCMKQSVTGERTLVAPAMWTPDRLMLWFGKDGLRVVERERVQPEESAVPRVGGWFTVRTVRGWFFVSQPHFDRICPPLAGSAPVEQDDEPLRAIDRAKAILLYLYPTKAQMPRSLKATTDAVVKECQKRDWKPPSEDRVQHALAELGYRPPRKRQ